jgi:alpha-L-arabinofuranosidase
MNTTRITLNPADTIATINPNLYDHFAEHLGRCIYEGKLPFRAREDVQLILAMIKS